MDSNVVVAALGFLGTLLGSLLGILAAQKLINHRVARLETRADGTDSRLRSVELQVEMHSGRLDTHDIEIKDLKKYHQPK